MVSVYRNPLPDREFARFSGFYMAGGGDRMDIPVMNVSDDDMLQAAPPVGKVDCAVDDPNKKIRKPYTITKSRESWSELEHDKFLEALHLFDRDWKKIEAFVVSKTIIQIRSHAQKYFLKVQKNGTSEHVPPPRPKRKAVHPYPQKASKKVVSQATCPSLSSASLLEPGYAVRSDALSIPLNLNGGEPLSSWTCNVVPTVCLSHISKDDRSLASATNNYSSSSSESTPRVWASNDTCRDVNRFNTRRVMPDFAQVYSFIGSVFDLNATDHLKRLRKMDPIDVEAVLMLMNNLCVNLASPQFEDHMRLLSLYNAGNGNDSMGSEIPSL